MTNTQRKRNREASDWLLRNSNPNLSQDERSKFEAWLDSDPENCRTYSAAERLMGDARQAIQSDPGLANIKVTSRSGAKPIVTTLVAAVLATGAFLAFDGPVRLEADVIAESGEMPVITLEDGSDVQLNASSAISIDFTEKRRTVHLLRGQAFFRVATAPGRPFTVEAGETSVTALGTAFDVRYGNTETDVTVTEHAVQIDTVGNSSRSIQVDHDEQAVYDHATRETRVLPVDSLVALAWKRGQLAVDNAPLSAVVDEMNRHFGGHIVITSSMLADRRVSGTIKVADTDDALAFVKKALGVKAIRLGPLIFLR
ncbi:FecR family protein [Rhizobium quercicola]|uniref:FecR family protein n=1 Tax=Rhizobium quercicola TaxID=2901226 RepID=UPI0030B89CE1